VGGNVRDGVHIASIGGTWMAIVYGLAGMRDYGGKLSFRPKAFVRKLKFPLTVRGQRLEVDIRDGSATYTLRQGEGLTIRHHEEELRLTEGKAVTRPLDLDASHFGRAEGSVRESLTTSPARQDSSVVETPSG
jgi:alpha,alpha-trehalose phosphorylase